MQPERSQPGPGPPGLELPLVELSFSESYALTVDGVLSSGHRVLFAGP